MNTARILRLIASASESAKDHELLATLCKNNDQLRYARNARSDLAEADQAVRDDAKLAAELLNLVKNILPLAVKTDAHGQWVHDAHAAISKVEGRE